jgi:glucose-1-phosphate thymidylyltransferase
MNYKGIILAGGDGKRLSPLTKAVNKHFLPVHDKPLIFYSLSMLMLTKIKDILLICKEKDLVSYKSLLGDGKRFGININYKIQNQANGIVEAFIIGEKFIKNSFVALVLGDNFFYGQGISKKLLDAKKKNINCTIFIHPVNNPSDFGVIKFDKKNKIKTIVEKPKKTSSNLAITGFYFFDQSVVDFSKKIKPSKRNEIEIISLIKMYNKKKKLNTVNIGRGSVWLDTGSLKNLENASSFVKNIEERQGFKIACLEEIALQNKWIKKSHITESLKFYGDCEYSEYLKKIIN